MKTINYKGKGEHSVKELELIIEQQSEELHLLKSGQIAINYTHCCTELPTIEDANSEMYKVSSNLKTDHKQTEVNYYESGFLTCFYWLTKRLTK